MYLLYVTDNSITFIRKAVCFGLQYGLGHDQKATWTKELVTEGNRCSGADTLK